MSHRNQRLQLPENTPKSSKTTINIAGFHVYLYGVDELTPQQARDTVVIFHIHGRTRNHKDAEGFAHEFLFQVRKRGDLKRGLVVATFDNRNHGSRAIDSVAIDDAVKIGREEIISMVTNGTVFDIKTVIKFLKVYVKDDFTPTEFVVSGLPLGGHVAWDVLASERTVDAAIAIVGSPNLTDMLVERLSKSDDANANPVDPTKWPESVARMYQVRDQNVAQIEGKKILILNGALDTLVPSKFTLPWVEKCGDRNDVSLCVFENTGHWLSLAMIDRIVDWMLEKII